jgi:hypothetical protein
LQQDLDQTAGPIPAVVEAIDKIPGIKYTPSDSMLPWLVWEYGLENVLPYLSDQRLALKEGVHWQRIHGTPDALKMAMGWLELPDTAIESEVPGEHFHEYQINTGQVVATSQLPNLRAVADYSAPLRARLKRLFHGYDVRRLVLDESGYGAMLSDYSGIDKDGLTLSFGRSHSAQVIPESIEVSGGAEFGRTREVVDIHWPMLDEQRLGGEKTYFNRISQYSFNIQPQSHIWSGTWDSRSWNDENIVFIGTSHTRSSIN